LKKTEEIFYPVHEDIFSANLFVNESPEIYTYQIANEHDTIFKDLFSDKNEARKFINQYLKLTVPIKEDELEAYNTCFITPEFRSKEADIVYKMKHKNIFFLIEHQSTIDLSMPYRIENYSMLIINRAVEKEKMKQKNYLYPKVIPIVLYTGEKKWKASISFSEVQEKLEGYQEEDKTYTIIDINDYTENQLLEDDLTISKILVLEKLRTHENFIDNIEKVIEKTKKEKQYVIEKIIHLILRKELGNEETEKLLTKLNKEKEEKDMFEEDMLLVGERLRKDKERQLRKSKNEGIKENKMKTAKRMLEEGLPIELIAKITELGKEKIEKLVSN